MPAIGFFGVAPDLTALLGWLLVDEGLHACEAYSAFESPLRHFRTPADVTSTFEVGKDVHGQGTAVHLALWNPEILPPPHARRISLNPASCGGATFRFAAASNSLIYLQLGGLHERVITQSTLAQNSERRAEAWGVAEGVDWERAQKLWGKISYHLRKRASVASAGGRPVLSEAYALVEDGYQLKQSYGSAYAFPITKRKG